MRALSVLLAAALLAAACGTKVVNPFSGETERSVMDEKTEVAEGKLFDPKGAKGRYVRLYSNGNTTNDLTHYVEVEVYGRPAK